MEKQKWRQKCSCFRGAHNAHTEQLDQGHTASSESETEPQNTKCSSLISYGLASLPIVCLKGKHCKQWHWLSAQDRGIFNSSMLIFDISCLFWLNFLHLGSCHQLLEKGSARQSLATHPAIVFFIKNPQTLDIISLKSQVTSGLSSAVKQQLLCIRILFFLAWKFWVLAGINGLKASKIQSSAD